VGKAHRSTTAPPRSTPAPPPRHPIIPFPRHPNGDTIAAMPDYRRIRIPGGTCFFTVALRDRNGRMEP
jgi:hypothetical protein